MGSNQLYLFKDKRFLPIFIVQFCGCLNDSIIKNALIILITFKLAGSLNIAPYLLVMLANALFISPFVIFASLAGQVADRYERSKIVKIIKSSEVGIILFSTYGFYYEKLTILFISLALMGIHSTFFGPIKYSVLPDKLKREELLAANGYIEAGTFMSIMLGTMFGGLYNLDSTLIIAIIVIISIIGLIASFFMPLSGNVNPDFRINPNIIKENITIVKYAYSRTKVYLAILGISWFWFIGAAILAQIPLLTKDILGADESVATLFLAVFSIGVGVGSFLCSKILANKITTKYVFIAAIGISFFCIDLYFASSIAEINYRPEQLKSLGEFLKKIHYWRILFDLFCLSSFGGFYVVPLFAAMQYFTSPAYRSRVIAANNLINSIFMASSTAILSLLFYMNFSITSVILIISILNFIVAIHIYKLIPNTIIIPLKLLQIIFRTIFSLFYKVEVKGIENYRIAGKRTVIIANHLSYIDPILMAIYIPEKLQFAINTSVANKWWVRPFLKLAPTYSIEPNNPMAIKSLIDEVKKNKKIVIFPEGRISLTGALMKVYEGPAMIADKSNAMILPIRVEGSQFTCFAKSRKVLKTPFSLRRKITINILNPEKVIPPKTFNNRERRKYISEALYEIMKNTVFESSDYKKTLFQSLIDSAKLSGMSVKILQDAGGNKYTYRLILFKSFVLGNLISKQTELEEKIGLMLPNTADSFITFFAIQSSGRVPAIINFSLGVDSVIRDCLTSQVKTIYTSLEFIKKEDFKEFLTVISEHGIKVIYLEDLKKNTTFALKTRTMICSIFPQTYYKYLCPKRNDQLSSVILFTSGTEGKSKAVVLSHRNIQSNRCQYLAMIDFNSHDLAFNAIPLFYSFGFTATITMLLGGVRTCLYPSPIHFRIIPEVIYDIGATIMFGTDSFLEAYALHSHAYDFYSIKYVISGVEKLKEQTQQTWFRKFGIRILESYGITEASLAVSINTPMYNKVGSVGKLLPKIEYFLQPVDGIHNGGKLYIKGPNIMLGYIKPENPGVIESPYSKGLGKEWHNTGDIAHIDSEGYINILGRNEFFVTISGEVISLLVIEDFINKIYNDRFNNVATCITDTRGEKQILLFTTKKDLTKEKIAREIKKISVSKLHIPETIVMIKKIPMLTNGKIDRLEIKALAKDYVLSR